MKLVISFLTLFFCFKSVACSFRQEKTVFSLSGPITYILKDLNLLKNVQGISLFHGLEKKDFEGDLIGGGIFVSPKYLKKFKNVLVFYDESVELKKNLLNQNVEIIEMKTRNMDPFEALDASLKVLSSQVVNCDKEILKIKKESLLIQNFFQKRTPLKNNFVFYLGELLTNRRKPNLIMVDHFVLYFKKMNLIKTYPTTLNYAPWAVKVINELKNKSLIEVGMANTNAEELNLSAISPREINFSQKSLLIPGLSQVRLMKTIWEKLEKQDSFVNSPL
jgi:hypothetical protein